MPDTKISCAVVVSSCDAYSDLWTPFFALFWKYWPDCPFPVYLVSNQKKFPHQNVIPLCMGGGHNDWSRRLCGALSRLDTDYVLLMLEDFFLRRPMQTQPILNALESLCQLKGDMLRLVPRPPADEEVAGFPLLKGIRPGAPYRVSTQSALWRRQTLMDLLSEGESIWEFELKGSRRSDSLNGFYSMRKSLLTYDHHVVERGKWFPQEAVRFGRMGISCDFFRRPIMSRTEMILWRISMIRSYFLQCIPWPQRIRLVNFVKKVLGR